MPTAGNMQVNITLEEPSDKLAVLYDRQAMVPYEYILLEGGRGGGKTEEVARWLLLESFNHSDGILCTREIQASIEDSVYAVLVEWIEVLGVEEFFTIIKNRIVNNITGAWFIFKGMQAGTDKKNTLKSLKGIRYVWWEEAQGGTKKSFDKLDPTIRIDGRKLFFTMNRDTEDDEIPKILAEKDNCKHITIQYFDNPWLPEVLAKQAADCKKYHPEEYNHIWLGQPLMEGERRTVMSLASLRMCVDAHKTIGHTKGHAYAGLDLAPGEKKKNDKNCLVIRKGAVIRFCRAWQNSDLDEVAEYSVVKCKLFSVLRLFYDAVGVGGFANKQLKKMVKRFLLKIGIVPFMGGAKVFGGDYPYIRAKGYEILNKDFFKNAKSQQWWNLRLRVENTVRMLNGETIADPTYYMSFDSDDIDPETLEALLHELSQATYKEDSSGRIVIDKAPGEYEVEIDGKKEKKKSPNMGDGTGYSYSRDFQLRGLRINK